MTHHRIIIRLRKPWPPLYFSFKIRGSTWLNQYRENFLTPALNILSIIFILFPLLLKTYSLYFLPYRTFVTTLFYNPLPDFLNRSVTFLLSSVSAYIWQKMYIYIQLSSVFENLYISIFFYFFLSTSSTTIYRAKTYRSTLTGCCLWSLRVPSSLPRQNVLRTARFASWEPHGYDLGYCRIWSPENGERNYVPQYSCKFSLLFKITK